MCVYIYIYTLYYIHALIILIMCMCIYIYISLFHLFMIIITLTIIGPHLRDPPGAGGVVRGVSNTLSVPDESICIIYKYRCM